MEISPLKFVEGTFKNIVKQVIFEDSPPKLGGYGSSGWGFQRILFESVLVGRSVQSHCFRVAC